MIVSNERTWLESMPKAENHLHLEGAISPELLLKLALRNGVRLPFKDEEEVKQYIQDNTKSLDTFINVFNVVNSVLLNEEDFYELAMDLARKGALENIVYREIMISFGVHECRGVWAEAIMKGLNRAREQALKELGVELKYIAELDRSKDAEWALDFVHRAAIYRENGIVGIGWALGLEGREEDNYTAAEHAWAFRRARTDLGLRTTAHCGEAQGPESVWDVLEHLKPERIDHGVRAAEDPKLMDELAQREILLAVCPSSNVMIGLYPDLAHHPLRTLMERGIKVSINTDDPAYIQDTLSNEYRKVGQALELSDEQLIELARNSFRYSFSGRRHMTKLDKWLEENR